MQKARSFLSGSLFGLLAGAAIALLFAPSSGEELRNQMQDRANRIQSDVKQAAETRRTELEQQLANLREPPRPQ